ncbi:MAG: hypothetical protein ACRD12_16495 [Acidimicrobiales bacterium]
MSKRVWAGVLAGVLSALVLLSVGLAAFRAGERREVVTSTVGGDGEVVRVIDGGYGWGHGPGPFFFVFPLLGIVAVILLVRGARGGWGGWRGYGGPPPWVAGGPHAAFEDWHRRAHEQEKGGDADPAKMKQ